MPSEYEYCTVLEVEAFAGQDYSVKLGKYTDTVIEAIISQGEREINTKTSSTFTSPIPDAIKSVAIELAYRRMYNRMVWDGVMDRSNPKKRLMPIWDDELVALITEYFQKNLSSAGIVRFYSGDYANTRDDSYRDDYE